MNRNSEGRKSQVRVARSAFAKIIVKRVMRGVGISFIALILVYVSFAGTIIRVIPSTSGTGFVAVKNNTFPGGTVPAGRKVLVDMKEAQGSSLMDRLKQSFVPRDSAAMVEIIAGPYGKLTWAQPSILSIDGNPAKAPMPAIDGKSPIGEDKDDWFLKNQYAVKCVSGACASGNAYIISTDNVLGIPLFNGGDGKDTGNGNGK